MPLSLLPDPNVSDDEGCTIPRQPFLFQSSLLQGFSLPSNTTNEVTPIASSLLHQQKEQTTTPSLQGLLTFLKIYISSVISPRLKELSSAQCFLVGYVF